MSSVSFYFLFFFFKQKTAYELRISDWSSDVCSSDLVYGMARPSRRHRVMVLVCLRGRSEPMTIVTLGIDLGKNLNSIVGLDVEGRVVLRRRVRRATLAELAGKLPPCTVAMEADRKSVV